MLTCQQVRGQFSDYYDGALDDEREQVADHIATCPACAAEYRSLVRTIDVIRAIPAEEPSIDLWQEFAPAFDAFEAEQKLTVRERVRRKWQLGLAQFSEGLILYTTQLAHRTTQRLAKYLISDPFSAKD
jgi:anti-sigma factor RsiW